VWAPAVYTFLAMNWGAAGWLVIAGIIVVATIGVHSVGTGLVTSRSERSVA
jgi:hypothetical protein